MNQKTNEINGSPSRLVHHRPGPGGFGPAPGGLGKEEGGLL